MRRVTRTSLVAAIAGTMLGVTLVPAAHAESSAPVLDGIERLSAPILTAGDELVVRVRAHDSGGAHFAHASVTFVGPYQTRLVVSCASDGAADTVELRCSEPTGRWAAAGTYQASEVFLDDWATNSTTIVPGVDLSWGAALRALEFQLQNDHEDTVAPRLADLAFTTATVSAGDTVTMTYTATDTGSGIEAVEAYLVADDGPGSDQRGILLRSPADPELAAVGPVAGQVPFAAVAGRYHVRLVSVHDRAGNTTTYFGTSAVAVDPQGLTKPPSMNLPSLGVQVSQPGVGDDVPPRLERLTMLTPKVLHPWEPAVVSFVATDTGSGVASVNLTTEDDEGHRNDALQNCGDFSDGRVPLWSPTYAESWRLVEVTVVDLIGNRTTYRLGQPPETSTGASVPAVDLSGVSFGYQPGEIREGPEPSRDCPVPEVSVTPDDEYVTPGTTVTLTGAAVLVDSPRAGGARLGNGASAGAHRTPVRTPVVAVYGRTAGRTSLLAVKRGSVKGTFRQQVKVRATTAYRVWLPGSGPSDDGALSAVATVHVGKKRTLVNRDDRPRVRHDGRVRLVVRASPAGHGERITLRRDWPRARKVATLTLNRRGKAHRWVRYKGTTLKFHWQTPYGGGYLPARSAKVVVRVTA